MKGGAELEFGAWEAEQPIRFELVDGVRRTRREAEQVSARLAKTWKVALAVIGDAGEAETWLSLPNGRLGGLTPAAAAARDEDGCQSVLRLLVSGRKRGDGG
jgi:uncharacterized protein (DUF2384 family)